MYYFFSHSRYKTAFVGVSRARHAHPRQIAPLEMYLCSSRSKVDQENRSRTNYVLSLCLSLSLWACHWFVCSRVGLLLCLTNRIRIRDVGPKNVTQLRSDTPIQDR